MPACCVSGCKNRYSPTTKLRFYRIPSGYRPFQANRRRLWLQALQQVNCSVEGLKGNARICGAHFISGEASMDHDSPDFVPSVFTVSTKQSPKKKLKRFYGRRRKCHRKASVEKEEITTPPVVDSPAGIQTSVLKETENELSEEIQTASTPSVPKEEETLNEEAEAETRTKAITSQTKSSKNKSPQSLKLPAGISKLDKMSPVVLLKPLDLPAGRYQYELGNRNFTGVSRLVKHKQPHEEQRVQQCVHTARNKDTSFPCNMCDRLFTTSHNLKRHKLLHVRDGRKCRKCGVLFCRRHKHILFLPQAAPVTESEQDSSIDELQNVGSDVMPENCPLQESEQIQTDDLDDDDAQGTITETPTLTTTAPLPTPNPGPLSKPSEAPPPASYTKVVVDVPVPEVLKPSSVPCPPSPVPRDLENPGTSSQLMTPLPDKPATFSQPLLPLNLDLPSSLKIFSPKFLTSALLEVKRNYEYILNKPKVVKKVIEVKEEPCELPLITPDEQSVEQVKKERIAYDLEIEI
ncbi:uncharacterized protein LOC130174193 [Seriola aureovittata]|uniref:uncharacterized protein LOC130174193 n=1 Tax=Seriola aureovittata TaxID=2871759 RepID=UPI0024BE36AF|nr:uncharacterized protein LOC130174193 [Seriola aureovittata]